MRFYEDIQRTSLNRLPPRAHYIPEGAAEYKLLNGNWRFAFFENGDFAAEPAHWSTIPVPSCWQLQGYEAPNYTNVNFPFPVDPPYVPNINPMGIYERDFLLDENPLCTYLVLEGICSCAEIYVNQKYVGFTQGSHLQAEFDLSSFVHPGKNTLRVNVHKWCAGSYLEDQDFLRFNGIFRDVYLLRRPKNHLWDFELQTTTDSIRLITDHPAQVRILDGEKLLTETLCKKELTVSIREPVTWNAEQPYLYTLELICAGEVIRRKFGLRTISLSAKNELLINGNPVKLRGVNHHDTTPDRGWSITREQIKEDLLLMKKLHINTIRTSHYPPIPYLVELADELGFYVILETDIESHGFIQRNPSVAYRYDVEDPVWPGNVPAWKAEHLSRMERALERFKNHCSVIMWSTGNESGHCPAHAEMLDYIHRRDPSRLAHCEDESRAGKQDRADVLSFMYPSIETLQKLAEDSDRRRPVFLCEYSHAMGNSPGDVWDYWEFFRQHQDFIGGCIWEWCDHAINYGGKLCYGGDFPGELTHDANFCCDGMLFADRSMKPGTLEIAATYAPMHAAWSEGHIVLWNDFDFTDFENYRIRLSLSIDGRVEEKQIIKLQLAPGNSAELPNPFTLPERCRLGTYLEAALLDEADCLLASSQLRMPVPIFQEESIKLPAELEETPSAILASGNRFSYQISKQTGALTSIKLNGKELLAAPVLLDAFRAPIDNEKNMVALWTQQNGWQGENLERQICNVHDVRINGNKITIEAAAAGVSRRPYLRYTLCLTVWKDGTIDFELDGKVAENAVWLPRLGFTFPMAQKNIPFTYFAMGPEDCYCDSCHHGAVGRYESNAEAEYVPYVYPQEHGNHILARELTIADALRFTGDDFEFQVLPYSSKELFAAKHQEELPDSQVSYVRIDYKNSGIGSNSCGPELAEAYRFSEKNVHFRFRMFPV